MRLLALDASTEACSAALLIGDELTCRYEEPAGGQGERILAMIEELLAEAGLRAAALDAIAAGVGPGAFTGVRIGVSVAQGLAFGADLRVVPIVTLEALAWRRIADGPVLACLDARMGEVYWGCYRAHPARGLVAQGQPRVGPVESVRPQGVPPLRGVGRAFTAYPSLRAAAAVAVDAPDARALPDARDMARLGAIRFAAGEALDPAGLAPVYLRDKVALTESERAAR
ncbi:MAG TPA: tRNA (adenosine(37)-N6)-threonylcarbamoyltransferase complex dimerization subunit type 1 TsaB [Steroidobacteraceae bacterium]|nr:tRNA (adenosine(37)-N6)-threonylcarbamoyltransferase complex dimerization subunit type 1 TsaB [Steroidobacteraceae bacterium]